MRAAFYECDVTPPLGGFMWGHYHEVLASDVKDRLYVKAVVTEDAGKYAAIISVDTCSLIPGIHEIVTKRIAQYTPIPAESVCITSNHSHSGAPISSDPSCGGKADEPYLDVFLRLCADSVILAYKRLDDVNVSFARGTVEGIAFNRNFVVDDGRLVTHRWSSKNIVSPLDETDPDLPVLFFERDGKQIGAIVNFSCHQCCLPKYNSYSGDYSSYISKHLKEKYGQDFVSLFVLAPCGDINHVGPDYAEKAHTDWYQTMGKLIADTVIEIKATAQPVSGSVAAIKEQIDIPRRPVDDKTVLKKAGEMLVAGQSSMRARNLLFYQRTHNGVQSDLLPVQAIVIGDVLISVLPGEVYNAFGREIKERSPYSRNMVIENANEYCGYIPTAKAFSEKSDLYEISLCHHSRHIPEAGDMLKEKVLSLANELHG